jgi:hypothetical protein
MVSVEGGVSGVWAKEQAVAARANAQAGAMHHAELARVEAELLERARWDIVEATRAVMEAEARQKELEKEERRRAAREETLAAERKKRDAKERKRKARLAKAQAATEAGEFE